MEDTGVLILAAVSEIEEDYEPFQNPKDIALCNDFIPDVDESSECSDSDDADEDEFCNDEVVEIISEVINEINHNQEPPMSLAQSSPFTTNTKKWCKYP